MLAPHFDLRVLSATTHVGKIFSLTTHHSRRRSCANTIYPSPTQRSAPMCERLTRCLCSSSLAVILAVAGYSLLASPVLAQNENETVGFSSTHIFDGGYFGENIDTLNGNLNLTIPIGPT